MAAKPSARKTTVRQASLTNDVEAFLDTLDHPLKPEILVVRRLILQADPGITEGIKWNAPSFKTSEYFATFHLRTNDAVQLILHLGAKKRDNTKEVSIDDPGSLLHWLATDRAMIRFNNSKHIQANRSAFTRIIKQWIQNV